MKRFKTRYAGPENRGVEFGVIDGDTVRIRETAMMPYKAANISPEQKIANEIKYRSKKPHTGENLTEAQNVANSVSDAEKLRLALASATKSKDVEQYNYGYSETSAASRFNEERGLKKGDKDYAPVSTKPTNPVRLSLINTFESDEVGGPAATSALKNILDKHLKRDPETGIQTIDINLSRPQGNQTDHYQRPIRHLWQPSPTNNKRSTLVSRALAKAGHGTVPLLRGGDREHYAKVKASEVLSQAEVRAKRQPIFDPTVRSLLLKSGRDTVPGQGRKYN